MLCLHVVCMLWANFHHPKQFGANLGSLRQRVALGQGRPKGLRQCFGCHIVAGTFLWHGGHIAFCGPAQCVTGIAKCGKKVPKGSCSCGWGYKPPPQRIWASILNTPQPQGYCCGGWAAPQLWGAHIYRHHPNCAMPIIKVFKL